MKITTAKNAPHSRKKAYALLTEVPPFTKLSFNFFLLFYQKPLHLNTTNQHNYLYRV